MKQQQQLIGTIRNGIEMTEKTTIDRRYQQRYRNNRKKQQLIGTISRGIEINETTTATDRHYQ